jgi:hypothetical protein
MSNKLLKEWIDLIIEKTIREAFERVPETPKQKASYRTIINWAKNNDDPEVVRDAESAEEAADRDDWKTAHNTLKPFIRYQLGRGRKRIGS